MQEAISHISDLHRKGKYPKKIASKKNCESCKVTIIRKKMSSLELLRLICMLIFLGWMVVWIVLPMEIFKYNWLPKLAEMFNPTYIGGQG